MWLLIIVGIIIIIAVLYVFAAAAAITLGVRNRDMCYYDPEDKQWHPLASLSEEQRLRMMSNSNKLRKRLSEGKQQQKRQMSFSKFPVMDNEMLEAYNILKSALEHGDVTPQPEPNYSSMTIEELKRLEWELQQKQLEPQFCS